MVQQVWDGMAWYGTGGVVYPSANVDWMRPVSHAPLVLRHPPPPPPSPGACSRSDHDQRDLLNNQFDSNYLSAAPIRPACLFAVATTSLPPSDGCRLQTSRGSLAPPRSGRR